MGRVISHLQQEDDEAGQEQSRYEEDSSLVEGARSCFCSGVKRS